MANWKYSNVLSEEKCRDFGNWYKQYLAESKDFPKESDGFPRDSRLTFHPQHEVPTLRQWYSTCKVPSDNKLQFFASELNKGHVRQERPKVTVPKLKIWWKNERQREKRIRPRTEERDLMKTSGQAQTRARTRRSVRPGSSTGLGGDADCSQAQTSHGGDLETLQPVPREHLTVVKNLPSRLSLPGVSDCRQTCSTQAGRESQQEHVVVQSSERNTFVADFDHTDQIDQSDMHLYGRHHLESDGSRLARDAMVGDSSSGFPISREPNTSAADVTGSVFPPGSSEESPPGSRIHYHHWS